MLTFLPFLYTILSLLSSSFLPYYVEVCFFFDNKMEAAYKIGCQNETVKCLQTRSFIPFLFFFFWVLNIIKSFAMFIVVLDLVCQYCKHNLFEYILRNKFFLVVGYKVSEFSINDSVIHFLKMIRNNKSNDCKFFSQYFQIIHSCMYIKYSPHTIPCLHLIHIFPKTLQHDPILRSDLLCSIWFVYEL